MGERPTWPRQAALRTALRHPLIPKDSSLSRQFSILNSHFSILSFCFLSIKLRHSVFLSLLVHLPLALLVSSFDPLTRPLLFVILCRYKGALRESGSTITSVKPPTTHIYHVIDALSPRFLELQRGVSSVLSQSTHQSNDPSSPSKPLCCQHCVNTPLILS
jgi:hypothetical protein